ncbi:nuclease-related domain-containing protein [Mycoplasma simbae]|uniref:nuclease-related domain-containing protein n=1 Tax=Mycoplasma simbae TaxID=36744 RepID=UPI000495FA7A|nr:nuclease-related domain-containing protein [Mycoplasma simbae]
MGLFFVLTISLLIYYSQRKNRKNTQGFVFEEQISRRLEHFAKNSEYKFIKGQKFIYAGEQHFEIDGFLYTDKFAIIVEVKYLKGTISGRVDEKQIKLSNGKKSKMFPNPLIQNLKHIEHFYKMCQFKLPMFSMLVLPANTQANFEGQASWSIVVNEDKIDDVLKQLPLDCSDLEPIDPIKIKAINDIVKAHKVVSLKDLRKWEKGIKNNAK